MRTVKQRFHKWHYLPDRQRKRLADIAPEFFGFRDRGCYSYIGTHNGEDDSVLFRTNMVCWDTDMPRLKRILGKGVRIAMFPRNRNTLDILFILPKR